MKRLIVFSVQWPWCRCLALTNIGEETAKYSYTAGQQLLEDGDYTRYSV